MISKEIIQNQLIDSDGIQDWLGIEKKEADQIIEVAHRLLENECHIPIPGKVPIKKLLDLLQIEDDKELPNFQ